MRKSTLYLILSIFYLVAFTFICTIFLLPNTIYYNILRLCLILLSFRFLWLHNIEKNNEFINNCDKNIDKLRKEYDLINNTVLAHSQLIYKCFPQEFINKYSVSIDEEDSYLLDFEDNIEQFKEESSKKEITNQFIVIACAMDSLISGWKIKTSIPENFAAIDDLIWVNCKLAVCVAFSLMNLSNDELKDKNSIYRLIELLYICYTDKNYGNISIIENEAMILELLYEKFKK